MVIFYKKKSENLLNRVGTSRLVIPVVVKPLDFLQIFKSKAAAVANGKRSKNRILGDLDQNDQPKKNRSGVLGPE